MTGPGELEGAAVKGPPMPGAARQSAPVFLFETAAEHLSRSVPVTAPDTTAGELRGALVGRRYDSATEIAVCEGERLVGVVPIEALLGARDDTRVRELMDPDPPVVASGADQEVAAWKAVEHHERSIAVVGARGEFAGFIPPDRLLAVLLHEHHEDLARLAGIVDGSNTARLALEEPVGRRLLHRLPWLVVGLVGVMLAADLVAVFGQRLESHVILAFFLPGIVYLADAVGTQTETLVVRGLSVGVAIRHVVGRELLTGLLIGIGLAAAAAPVAFVRWGQGPIVLVLACSLLAACSLATVVAVVLPCALHRLGLDPAYGSGPLATVVQDLLSIAIYFGVAALVLG